jgi:hypothetical protein
MRYVQITVFVLALAALVAATFFIGEDTGDTMWRIGVAVLLIDVVCIMLWPRSPRGSMATPAS